MINDKYFNIHLKKEPLDFLGLPLFTDLDFIIKKILKENKVDIRDEINRNLVFRHWEAQNILNADILGIIKDEHFRNEKILTNKEIDWLLTNFCGEFFLTKQFLSDLAKIPNSYDKKNLSSEKFSNKRYNDFWQASLGHINHENNNVDNNASQENFCKEEKALVLRETIWKNAANNIEAESYSAQDYIYFDYLMNLTHFSADFILRKICIIFLLAKTLLKEDGRMDIKTWTEINRRENSSFFYNNGSVEDNVAREVKYFCDFEKGFNKLDSIGNKINKFLEKMSKERTISMGLEIFETLETDSINDFFGFFSNTDYYLSILELEEKLLEGIEEGEGWETIMEDEEKTRLQEKKNDFKEIQKEKKLITWLLFASDCKPKFVYLASSPFFGATHFLKHNDLVKKKYSLRKEEQFNALKPLCTLFGFSDKSNPISLIFDVFENGYSFEKAENLTTILEESFEEKKKRYYLCNENKIEKAKKIWTDNLKPHFEDADWNWERHLLGDEEGLKSFKDYLFRKETIFLIKLDADNWNFFGLYLYKEVFNSIDMFMNGKRKILGKRENEIYLEIKNYCLIKGELTTNGKECPMNNLNFLIKSDFFANEKISNLETKITSDELKIEEILEKNKELLKENNNKQIHINVLNEELNRLKNELKNKNNNDERFENEEKEHEINIIERHSNFQL